MILEYSEHIFMNVRSFIEYLKKDVNKSYILFFFRNVVILKKIFLYHYILQVCIPFTK